MDMFRKTIRFLLYLACFVALAFSVYRLIDFIQFFYAQSLAPATAIPYTKLQLTLLTDLAKTLVPVVSGSIALTGAGIAFLHKHKLLAVPSFQVGIFTVFSLAIISLACWVSVLSAVVDAARVFVDTGLAQQVQDISKYALIYAGAVTAAQIGASTFFAVCGVVAIIGTYFFDASPADDDTHTPGEAMRPGQQSRFLFFWRRWP